MADQRLIHTDRKMEDLDRLLDARIAASAHGKTADLEERIGNYGNALLSYQDAVSLDPEDADALAQDLELLDRGGALDVGGDQQRVAGDEQDPPPAGRSHRCITHSGRRWPRRSAARFYACAA